MGLGDYLQLLDWDGASDSHWQAWCDAGESGADVRASGDFDRIVGRLRDEFPQMVPFERGAREVDGGCGRVSRSQQSDRRKFRSSHFSVRRFGFFRCEVKEVFASHFCLN